MKNNRNIEEAKRRIRYCIENRKEKLDLSELGLIEIPEEVEECAHILNLDISRNQISEIKNLEKLIELQTLDLFSNQISEIKNLEKLIQLKDLYLFNNQISEIKNLEKLIELQNLELSDNQISEIKKLEELIELQTLDLSSNQINEIKNLEKLSQLQGLYLFNNQISEIKNLEKLIELQTLDISRNEISEIKNLESLTDLQNIYLAGNQINSVIPIKSIINQLYNLSLEDNPVQENIGDLNDIKVLKDYFENLDKKSKPQANDQLKVNIIGQGRIGKTQLLKYFKGEPFVPNDHATHGTNTAKNETLLKDKTVIFWDFGGQSYHHGLHEMFIRRRDINIVLYRNEDNLKVPDYKYWLGTAREYSNSKTEGQYDAPLLLVQNMHSRTEESNDDFMADDHHYPAAETVNYYQVAPENIFYLDVQELHKKRKDKFRDRHQYFEKRLSRIVKDYLAKSPANYIEAKNQLIEDSPFENKLFIERADFIAHFPEELQATSEGLLDYLDFTGSILYFNDVELLKDYVFLDPPKVSDWLYQKMLQYNKDDEDLPFKVSYNQLLKNTGKEGKIAKDIVAIFLALMRHYNLIFDDPLYEEEDKEKYYFIPAFLPTYDHAFKKIILRILPHSYSLWFRDYIHESRIFNFIADYGQYIEDHSALWRYGILFTKDNINCLIYYLREERKLMIHIQNKKNQSELASEIFNYFMYEKETPKTQGLLKIGTRGEEANIDNKLPNIKRRSIEKEHFKNATLKNVRYANVAISTKNGIYVDIKETKENIRNKMFFGSCVTSGKRIKLDYTIQNLLMPNNHKKVNIFFSYSHKDEEFRDILELHLASLKTKGMIETWYDRKITPGKDFNDEIKENIERADIALLMTSPYFINSGYIMNKEVALLEKQDFTTIIPIFTRPVDLSGFSFADNQSLMTDRRLDTGTSEEKTQLPYLNSTKFDIHETCLTIVKKLENIIKAR